MTRSLTVRRDTTKKKAVVFTSSVHEPLNAEILKVCEVQVYKVLINVVENL